MLLFLPELFRFVPFLFERLVNVREDENEALGIFCVCLREMVDPLQ